MNNEGHPIRQTNVQEPANEVASKVCSPEVEVALHSLPGGGSEAERSSQAEAILDILGAFVVTGFSLVDFETQTHRSSMAPYHIRKYQESDRPWVLGLLSQGMDEHVPRTFCHLLKLPRTLVLLLGGPLALFLVSSSWLLVLMASLTLLIALRFLAQYPWSQFVANSLHTDMSDISKSYLSEPGSCFWVAECEGQVVAMVGALPAEEPTARKEQLQMLHLSVALEHRRRGLAKALVRTVLQFAARQGYREVVLTTSMMQHAALALYQHFGFQTTRQYFFTKSWALIAVPEFQLTYWLPSAQDLRHQGRERANDLFPD